MSYGGVLDIREIAEYQIACNPLSNSAIEYSHLSPEHRQSVVERIVGAGLPRTGTE
jgi:hypothetical protein